MVHLGGKVMLEFMTMNTQLGVSISLRLEAESQDQE